MTAPGTATGADHSLAQHVALNIALLTVSDSRTAATDKSGAFLAQAAGQAGHQVVRRELCIDDIYALRAVLAGWIADAGIQCIITTGGTGLRDRDVTPEAVSPLLDVLIDGFGELFRHHSMNEIGSSMLQSRTLAGVANRTLVICLPGSTGACRTAWDMILAQQLDSTHRPCNFVEILHA